MFLKPLGETISFGQSVAYKGLPLWTACVDVDLQLDMKITPQCLLCLDEKVPSQSSSLNSGKSLKARCVWRAGSRTI